MKSESRRQPILEAMIRIMGSKGYLAASVADVIAEADTSRTTFYKHFGDKEMCFLAAYDAAIERVLDEGVAGCEEQHSWVERTRAGLAAIVELLATEPELARTAIVEVAVAGAQARRHQWTAIGRFARLLEAGREPQGGAKLPGNAALMAVSAVVGLLLDELRVGQTADRLGLLPELEFALLVPFLGPRIASEAFQRVTVA